MKTIYRYPLAITDIQTIEVPFRFKILDAQFKDGVPCLWCEVETDHAPKGLTIEIIGTGNPMIDLDPGVVRRYIATIQHTLNGYTLVWHLYRICGENEL